MNILLGALFGYSIMGGLSVACMYHDFHGADNKPTPKDVLFVFILWPIYMLRGY